MPASALAVIGAGFGLGLVHAFDADHVMAVSALSSKKPGILRTLRYSISWALGHGGVLLLSGLLLFGLGMQLPESVLHWAEASVGVLLIAIGLMCFWRFRQQKIQLVSHRHGSVVHTHWQISGQGHGDHPQAHAVTDSTQPLTAGDKHAPVMVGVLHGLAGSAPALALVPVVTQGQFSTALGYLLVFSLGVTLAMASFGLGFGAVQHRLQRLSYRLFQASRYLVASGSVVLGGFWLSQSL